MDDVNILSRAKSAHQLLVLEAQSIKYQSIKAVTEYKRWIQEPYSSD